MKAIARHILLAALLLQAMVPLGWMPGAPALGQAAWIICTADGTHRIPGRDQGHRQGSPCAFASAHVMAPPAAQLVSAPFLQVAAFEPIARGRKFRVVSRFAPQSPRAPPLSA